MWILPILKELRRYDTKVIILKIRSRVFRWEMIRVKERIPEPRENSK
jgi:hypothetical protein